MGLPQLPPMPDRIKGDGEKDNEALGDGVDKGRCIHHCQTVHDCSDQDNPYHGAGKNTSLASEQACSAEDGGGDDDELVPFTKAGRDATDLSGR